MVAHEARAVHDALAKVANPPSNPYELLSGELP